MQYKQLGPSGLKVSELALGTWVFGPKGNPDPDDCARIIHAALDAGINLIDTADVYQGGESERFVSRAIKGRRHEVVLATKVQGRVGPGPNDVGLSRKHIMTAIDESLRRLDTDYIDLYQIHAMDFETPPEETLRTLDDIVASGKARYVGSSNQFAWKIMENEMVARENGLTRFISEQPPFSIFDRRSERDVFPACQRLGLGTICWSPLNFGWLSGKYRRGREIEANSRAATQRTPIHEPDSDDGRVKLDLVEVLLPMAAEAGATLSQYALAWTTMHAAVTAPILGPRTLQQLQDNMGATAVIIPAEHLAKIDELVPPGTRIGTSIG